MCVFRLVLVFAGLVDNLKEFECFHVFNLKLLLSINLASYINRSRSRFPFFTDCDDDDADDETKWSQWMVVGDGDDGEGDDDHG